MKIHTYTVTENIGVSADSVLRWLNSLALQDRLLPVDNLPLMSTVAGNRVIPVN